MTPAEFKARVADMGIVKRGETDFYAGFKRMNLAAPPLRTLELPYPTHTGNHSVRHTQGRHYLTPEAEAYRLAVKERVQSAVQMTGPLRAEWIVAPPDRKARDIDNLMKVVCDALTLAGFWKDDSNKVISCGSWRWSEPVAGGVILLTVFKE